MELGGLGSRGMVEGLAELILSKGNGRSFKHIMAADDEIQQVCY